MTSTAIDTALTKAEWQKVIFSDNPSRYELSALKPDWPLDPVKINVHRNHSFEFIASLIPAFAAYANLHVEFTYSEYDDSLAFQNNQDGDIELLWIDFDRYADLLPHPELLDWFADRLNTLRAGSSRTIIVCNWASTRHPAVEFNKSLEALAEGLADTFVCNQAALASDPRYTYFDERNIPLAGTALSNRSCIETARLFGLVWLPSVVRPRMKAVIVDLDNTLYAGILSEDGAGKLQLNPSHVALQNRLARLHTAGILLAVCSKNDATAVEQMFRKRDDFPLSADIFSAMSTNWDSKAEGVRNILDTFNISADSALFIDDNPAEIASVLSEHPLINSLLASDGEATTDQALRYFPCLQQWHKNPEDNLRSSDIKANQERRRLRSATTDNSDYLKALHMKLTFYLNPGKFLTRLHELSNKTNQFNTSLLRLSERDISTRLSDKNCLTVGVRLKDRLSDSGIIGALFTRMEGDTVIVEEACISCRALGRGVESTILSESLLQVMEHSSAQTAILKARRGPKNQPAMDHLNTTGWRILSKNDEQVAYKCSKEQLIKAYSNDYMEISWE